MDHLVATTRTDRKILGIIGPLARSMGFDVVRLRMRGGQNKSLQIMAERADGGMDVRDCSVLSRAISVELDVRDPISGKYMLEVSSPGIDRPLTRLEHFAAWAGHDVKIETTLPMDGRSRFRGMLLGTSDEDVLVAMDDSELSISFGIIRKARLVMSDALLDAASGKRPDNQKDPLSESSGESK